MPNTLWISAWLAERPEVSEAFERFCLGPARPDLLLPLEQRPLTADLSLDEAEEQALWGYALDE